MLDQYFKDIFKTLKPGDTREESLYSDLKKLLENFINKKTRLHYVTALPKRTEGGNPDFRIWDGKNKITGYIEAKSPTTENLDMVETTEQLRRYRDTFPNLILTNFFEFRLYRNGQLIDKIQVGRPFIIAKLRVAPPIENEDKFLQLLEKFFAFSTPKITTAKSLAIELAKRTRFLRDNVINEELKEEKIEGTQPLEGFYKTFKHYLISSLELQDFSNLFAQTITYGLFVARSRTTTEFNRKIAYDSIPRSIGILRDVFSFISSSDLPKSMEWIIDDISEVLALANVNKLIQDYYKEGKGHDPIVHFYETFLAEYDPKEREKRGVYYTPEPVVNYIVKSVHKLLREKLGKIEGFANPNVTVLDPAAGTLTFPVSAIRIAIDDYKKRFGKGSIKFLIKNQILKNFIAFELMMASYVIGHLKIAYLLSEYGYKLDETERFKLYLTNTLEIDELLHSDLPLFSSFSDESHLATKIKKDKPIMVIIGNPPYSGISDNKGEWILNQISEYKKVNGAPLGEKNPKWLQDDYVKFIRFAQWKIDQAGGGILGYITNHSWLDNPTFRGMRSSILNTFDEIYILNLHGSTLKKEVTPKGGKDENVFDIQTGVSITLAIKGNVPNGRKVYYSDLWGLREEKYNWLEKNDVTTTDWKTINPSNPNYFMVSKDEKNLAHYQIFTKITDIFPISSVGIVSGRDDFVIDFEKQSLETRIRIFVDMINSDDFIKDAYNLKDKPASNWSVKTARDKLKNDPQWEVNFAKILYRPFDERWIFYHDSLIGRTRKKVMKNMFKENLGFLYTRPQSPTYDFFVLASDKIIDQCVVGNKSAGGGISYLAPLYIYSAEEKQSDIFNDQEKSNIASRIFKILTITYKNTILPEEIFYYIYAVLYSNTYKQKYKEFLKTDFPRIPFTKDYQIFKTLVKIGHQLVNLHLLKSSELDNPIAKFQGRNGNKVEKREYVENDKRIYINNSQYFSSIESDVWNYYIGGYQILDRWLKDRKGRSLSSEDVKHYCKVATVLSKTIEIQGDIDNLYPNVEKNLINI